MSQFGRFIYAWNLAGNVVWKNFTNHTALRNFCRLSRISFAAVKLRHTSCQDSRWSRSWGKSLVFSFRTSSAVFNLKILPKVWIAIQGKLSVEHFFTSPHIGHLIDHVYNDKSASHDITMFLFNIFTVFTQTYWSFIVGIK